FAASRTLFRESRLPATTRRRQDKKLSFCATYGGSVKFDTPQLHHFLRKRSAVGGTTPGPPAALASPRESPEGNTGRRPPLFQLARCQNRLELIELGGRPSTPPWGFPRSLTRSSVLQGAIEPRTLSREVREGCPGARKIVRSVCQKAHQ